MSMGYIMLIIIKHIINKLLYSINKINKNRKIKAVLTRVHSPCDAGMILTDLIYVYNMIDMNTDKAKAVLKRRIDRLTIWLEK
jgi:hypothetical protein